MLNKRSRTKPEKAETATIGGMLRTLEPGTLMVMTDEGRDRKSAGHKIAALTAIDVHTARMDPKQRMDVIADLAGRLEDMDDFDIQVMLVTDLEPHECGRA